MDKKRFQNGQYMAENGFTFFNMNDNLDEIGTDPETDFYEDHYLNTPGANKLKNYFSQKSKSLKIL